MTAPVQESTPATARTALRAWASLVQAETRVMRELEESGDFDPVTAREYGVLAELAESDPAEVRLRSLNRRVQISQPSLSRLVDRLHRRGLLTRRTDQHDARGVLVGLTAQGRELQRTIGHRHVRSLQRCLGGALSEAELQTLTALTDRLNARAEEGVPR